MNKLVILMRAIPGSGKTTLAQQLLKRFQEEGKRVLVVSADKFFENLGGGTYKFDFRLLPEAHGDSSTSRALLLDIDAFSEREFAPESDDLWAEFDQLRKIKNACFFDSLQPATWKAYV